MNFFGNEIKRLQGLELKNESLRVLSDIASQVAHDIRSPLSALSMVTNSLTDIPEEKRLLIRNATQRINDIANDLLYKSKKSNKNIIESEISDGHFKSEVILIPALVDSLISEKRIQFRDQINITIDTDFSNSFGAFAVGDSKEIMRILSNLINNSVEAFESNIGRVKVTIEILNNKIALIVSDNGKGIPPEVLNSLGEKKLSYGKEDSSTSGSGIGIFHAKNYINQIGGKFNISSKINEGTKIEILLNKAENPQWFLKSIDLKSTMQVISLDDDLTIHQIWNGRLQSMKAFESKIQIKNFTSALEFKKFVETISVLNCYFLIDYELLGQNTNGLKVIEELIGENKLSQNIALVTSRYR